MWSKAAITWSPLPGRLDFLKVPLLLTLFKVLFRREGERGVSEVREAGGAPLLLFLTELPRWLTELRGRRMDMVEEERVKVDVFPVDPVAPVVVGRRLVVELGRRMEAYTPGPIFRLLLAVAVAAAAVAARALLFPEFLLSLVMVLRVPGRIFLTSSSPRLTLRMDLRPPA